MFKVCYYFLGVPYSVSVHFALKPTLVKALSKTNLRKMRIKDKIMDNLWHSTLHNLKYKSKQLKLISSRQK